MLQLPGWVNWSKGGGCRVSYPEGQRRGGKPRRGIKGGGGKGSEYYTLGWEGGSKAPEGGGGEWRGTGGRGASGKGHTLGARCRLCRRVCSALSMSAPRGAGLLPAMLPMLCSGANSDGDGNRLPEVLEPLDNSPEL